MATVNRRLPQKCSCHCECPKPVVDCSELDCWPQDDRDLFLLVCERDDASGLPSCPWLAAYAATPLNLGAIPWATGTKTIVSGPIVFQATFYEARCDPDPDLTCDVNVTMSNIRTTITWPANQQTFSVEVMVDLSWTDCGGGSGAPTSATDVILYTTNPVLPSGTSPTDCFDYGEAWAERNLFTYNILCNEGVITGGFFGDENGCSTPTGPGNVTGYLTKNFVIPEDALTGSCESAEYKVVEWSVSDNTDEAWIIEDCSGNVTRTDLDISTKKTGYYRRVGDDCCVYLHAKNECGEVQKECVCDPGATASASVGPPRVHRKLGDTQAKTQTRIVSVGGQSSEFDRWPKWARILARCRIEGERGPGDTFTRYQAEDWDRMAQWARRHDIRRFCANSKNRWNVVMRYSQLDGAR